MKKTTRFLIRWRWAFLTAAVIAAVLAYPLADNLSFDRSIENMFAKDDPLLRPYRKLKRVFGGEEVVMAAYIDPNLMTTDGYERVQRLTQQLSGVDGVRSAMSLANTPLGEKIIEDTPAATRLLHMLEGYAVGPPVNGQRTTAAVVCILEPESPDLPRRTTIEAIRGHVQKHDASGVIAGEPVMVIDGFQYVTEDGQTLGYTSLILLSLTILLCFRSVRWVIIPLLVIQLTLVLTRAALVLSRLQLSMVSSMLTAIVTVVAVATVIHFIVRFRDARAAGATPLSAVVTAGRLLAKPIALACATDAVGFAALMWAQVGPVQDFGVMMAIGSLLVVVSAAALLPALSLWGSLDVDPRRAWGEKSLDAGLSRLVDTLLARPKLVGTVCLVVAVVVALGGTRLEVETNFMRNFRRSSPIVRSYQFVETKLGGAGALDVIVPAPAQLDVEFLNRLRNLEARLRNEVVALNDQGQTQPGLTKVLSLTDLLDAVEVRQLLDVMPAEKLVELVDLPPTAKQLAKFLPLEAVLRRIRIEDYLTPEGRLALVEAAMRKATGESDTPGLLAALRGSETVGGVQQHYVRVMLRAREQQPATEKTRIIWQVQQIAEEEFPPTDQAAVEVTGFYVLLTSLVESMIRDQWICFAWAVAGIGLMMLLAFRIPSVAVIAIVPNAVPILMVTGLLGWLNVKINMGAAMIAAVSMGLSIDSSIHYISFYLRERRHGVSVAKAIHEVHQSVGRAMVFSTLALIVGFTALCRSEFVPTIYFGALVSLSMLGGLLGNLIVLPLLLLWTDGRKK